MPKIIIIDLVSEWAVS